MWATFWSSCRLHGRPFYFPFRHTSLLRTFLPPPPLHSHNNLLSLLPTTYTTHTHSLFPYFFVVSIPHATCLTEPQRPFNKRDDFKKTVPSVVSTNPTMDFARSELVEQQPVLNTTAATGLLGATTDQTLDTLPPAKSSTAVYGEYEGEVNDDLADGMTTPTRRSNSSIGSPSTSDDFDVHFSTPPPMPAFTYPPSPPRPAYNTGLEHIARRLQLSRLPESAVNSVGSHQYDTRTGATSGGDKQSIYKRWFRAQLPDSLPTDSPLPDDMIPRRPLTSIAGSNRCLWPPDTTFLTMSTGATSRDLSSQNHDRGFNQQQSTNNGATSSSLGSGATSYMIPTATTNPQKNHDRSDSFKDIGECLLDLQPRRKARRTLDGPYFKERNDRMVASHVQKLIQEAVEDGVGELDLRYVLCLP